MDDVIIIGGSYAGMAAGLQLARARRSVRVIDAGERRNRFAKSAHGFLGQDGKAPAQIASEAKAQLLAYPTVSWIEGRAQAVTPVDEGFAVSVDGTDYAGRRIILALGVTDGLPPIDGLSERWGQHVFHCPYCHGYELNQGPIGVIAVNEMALHQAMMLPDWGPTTLFLNDALVPDAAAAQDLARRGVTVVPGAVTAIEGEADVVLANGARHAMAGLFVASRTSPSSPLAQDLGCALEEGPLASFIATDAMKATTVSNVFACGDAGRAMGSLSFAVADGALAGAAVHRSLLFAA